MGGQVPLVMRVVERKVWPLLLQGQWISRFSHQGLTFLLCLDDWSWQVFFHVSSDSHLWVIHLNESEGPGCLPSKLTYPPRLQNTHSRGLQSWQSAIPVN